MAMVCKKGHKCVMHDAHEIELCFNARPVVRTQWNVTRLFLYG
jgi:hypothetical protein